MDVEKFQIHVKTVQINCRQSGVAENNIAWTEI